MKFVLTTFDYYRRVARIQHSYMQPLGGTIFVLSDEPIVYRDFEYHQNKEAIIREWAKDRHAVNTQILSGYLFVAIENKSTSVEFKLTFC